VSDPRGEGPPPPADDKPARRSKRLRIAEAAAGAAAAAAAAATGPAPSASALPTITARPAEPPPPPRPVVVPKQRPIIRLKPDVRPHSVVPEAPLATPASAVAVAAPPEEHRSWRREPYEISTDPARLDVDAIHQYLVTSYWARGIPREVVERSIQHSLNLGMYEGRRLIGYARWVTDRATVAYLGDVFVLERWRGKGLGRWLVETATSHPDVQGMRRWMLLTRDAHPLYKRVGFKPLEAPDRWMERRWPDAYGPQDEPQR
jgi:GNAT superfamily N-acetyltransferase